MYAILDIETTGGKYNEEGITEIAIYKFDGHHIVDKFVSLVNPEREIQPFVVKLTGIHKKMLTNAPKFYEVAKRIIEITKDCVLVAHNAEFDSRILATEFRRLGYDFQRPTLCTVILSKKLLPEKPSYKLGKLCRSLGIPVSSRHRADGDALATVELFKLLLEKDTSKEIVKNLVKDNPQTLTKKLQNIIEELPTKNGIFYLYNSKKEIIYIGKGTNLKKTANQLFLKTTPTAKKIQNLTQSASFEKTGSRIITQLKYAEQLKLHRPIFNKIQNKKYKNVLFNHKNMCLIGKGRMVGEQSAILIEHGAIKGYCFFDLNHQINAPSILHNLLTPLKNSYENRSILKEYLANDKFLKIIRF
ncbi:MAG: DNA polymerase III subunit epsilon [Flavobacteriaceae bacterium]|nr:DNA polymerase III subunit epsilon [Flavobacteriaceae bacterium]